MFRQPQATTSAMLQPLRTVRNGDFSLLETTRYTPASGFWLLDRHLQRQAKSAKTFGYPFEPEPIRQALEQAVAQQPPAKSLRLRWLVHRTGQIEVQATPLPETTTAAAPYRVKLAEQPVAADDLFLRHKTTERSLYQQAKALHSDYDDVLLWNEAGLVTECCIGNLSAELAGETITPALEAGLLAGTLRQSLIDQGSLRPYPLRVEQLQDCQHLCLINSVRGSVPITLTL